MLTRYLITSCLLFTTTFALGENDGEGHKCYRLPFNIWSASRFANFEPSRINLSCINVIRPGAFSDFVSAAAKRPSPFRKYIDVADCPEASVLDLDYVNAYLQFQGEANHGAVAQSHQVLVDEEILQCKDAAKTARHEEYYENLLDHRTKIRLYTSNVRNLLADMAEKRHALALRTLGDVYRYGVGVEVNLAAAWAFYDTYNLVAGSDGKDSFRDAVGKDMTALQVREAIGLARLYRDKYTDAYKQPSISIIN